MRKNLNVLKKNMLNPRICKYHPVKPANKICWTCKRGLCKWCGKHNGKNYFCDECYEDDTTINYPNKYAK